MEYTTSVDFKGCKYTVNFNSGPVGVNGDEDGEFEGLIGFEVELTGKGKCYEFRYVHMNGKNMVVEGDVSIPLFAVVAQEIVDDVNKISAEKEYS